MNQTRYCIDCHVNISDLNKLRLRCDSCKGKVTLKYHRDYMKFWTERNNNAIKARIEKVKAEHPDLVKELQSIQSR